MSNDVYNLAMAVIVGDGHITPSGSIQLHHSVTQKEWMLYKTRLLADAGFKMRIAEDDISMSYGAMRTFSRAYGYRSENSKKLRSQMYPNGFKVIPEGFKLCFESLAIIYQDDGRCNKLAHYGVLKDGVRIRVDTKPFVNKFEFCFESFDTESNKRFMVSLLSLGIESWLDKHNRIIVSRKESKTRMYEGIKQFMHPSMMYKLSVMPHINYVEL